MLTCGAYRYVVHSPWPSAAVTIRLQGSIRKEYTVPLLACRQLWSLQASEGTKHNMAALTSCPNLNRVPPESNTHCLSTRTVCMWTAVLRSSGVWRSVVGLVVTDFWRTVVPEYWVRHSLWIWSNLGLSKRPEQFAQQNVLSQEPRRDFQYFQAAISKNYEVLLKNTFDGCRYVVLFTHTEFCGIS